MSKIELKPCPFCGGEAELKFDKPFLRSNILNQFCIGVDVFIRCKKCHFQRNTYTAYVDLEVPEMELKGPIWKSRTVKHVVNEWNRRADDEKD